MECMNEHTGLISSYQLLITAACTNTGGKMKGNHPEQLTGAHLYLDIAKSGYLFHAVGNVMGNSWGMSSDLRMQQPWGKYWSCKIYCQTSNISHILVGNKIVDHSDLTPGFNGLGKGNSKMRQETFKFGDLVHLPHRFDGTTLFSVLYMLGVLYCWKSLSQPQCVNFVCVSFLLTALLSSTSPPHPHQQCNTIRTMWILHVAKPPHLPLLMLYGKYHHHQIWRRSSPRMLKMLGSFNGLLYAHLRNIFPDQSSLTFVERMASSHSIKFINES